MLASHSTLLALRADGLALASRGLCGALLAGSAHLDLTLDDALQTGGAAENSVSQIGADCADGLAHDGRLCVTSELLLRVRLLGHVGSAALDRGDDLAVDGLHDSSLVVDKAGLAAGPAAIVVEGVAAQADAVAELEELAVPAD